MKYLSAEKQATQYFFRVHTDESKVLDEQKAAELNLTVGDPDPTYVREYAWGLTPPEGQTETQYLANIKREIGLLVADELSRMNPAPAPAPTLLIGF